MDDALPRLHSRSSANAVHSWFMIDEPLVNVEAGASVESTGANAKFRASGLLLRSLFSRRLNQARVMDAAGSRLADLIGQGKLHEISADEREILAAIVDGEWGKMRRKLAVMDAARDVLEEEDGAESKSCLASVAPPEIHGGGDSADAGADADWLLGFWAQAENVGSDEMRRIYGKLLADKARVRGQFSKRTLSVLSYMDANIARLFADKVLPFVIDRNWMMPGFGVISGISEDELNLLEDVGLVAVRAFQPRKIGLAGVPEYSVTVGRSSSLVVVNPGNATNFGVHSLTQPGVELFGAPDSVDTPRVYLERMANWFLSNTHAERVIATGPEGRFEVEAGNGSQS